MSRKKLATGALALTAAMGLVVTASPAYAGTSQSIDVAGGFVYFEDHGDNIGAWDERKDGFCMTAELKWSGGSARSSACGAGAKSFKNLSIKEGTRVTLTACYTSKEHVGTCSAPQYGTA